MKVFHMYYIVVCMQQKSVSTVHCLETISDPSDMYVILGKYFGMSTIYNPICCFWLKSSFTKFA